MNKIEEFVKRYEKRSMNTVKCYRSHLNLYFKTIKCDPNDYFNDKRDYKADVIKFWDAIVDKPPKSRKAMIYCLKAFLMRNDVELKTLFWKDLIEQGKGNKAISEEMIPSNEQLKEILTHANAKERALFLIACTSGMRIGEIIQLEIDNVKLKENPVRIAIPGNITKSGDKRFTFITDETKLAIEQWLRVRDVFLHSIKGKLNFKRIKYNRDPNDKRLFPFAYSTALNYWTKLITKAGFTDKDKQTDRYKMHIHCLRKFAKTHMLLTMPENLCNYIIGHTGYLTREYEEYTPFQIIPEYKRAKPNLAIFQTSSNERVNTLDEQLKEKDKEIAEMQKRIDSLENKYGDLLHELVVKKK